MTKLDDLAHPISSHIGFIDECSGSISDHDMGAKIDLCQQRDLKTQLYGSIVSWIFRKREMH